jgi:hypothetical protein
MWQWISLLLAHVLLLVLASTNFTVLTGLGDGQFQWEYFRYAKQSGWGVPYEFPYSLPVVITYLAAYGAGLAAYVMAWRRGLPVIGAVGSLLCAIGFASFTYELTHWFNEHYRSWILSAPAALFVLAVVAVAQGLRFHRQGRMT